MKHTVEITKEAFYVIIGNNQPTAIDDQGIAVKELYSVLGCNLLAVTNYYSHPVTQYYIQDINA